MWIESIRIDSGLVGIHTLGESGRMWIKSGLEPQCKRGCRQYIIVTKGTTAFSDMKVLDCSDKCTDGTTTRAQLQRSRTGILTQILGFLTTCLGTLLRTLAIQAI